MISSIFQSPQHSANIPQFNPLETDAKDSDYLQHHLHLLPSSPPCCRLEPGSRRSYILPHLRNSRWRSPRCPCHPPLALSSSDPSAPSLHLPLGLASHGHPPQHQASPRPLIRLSLLGLSSPHQLEKHKSYCQPEIVEKTVAGKRKELVQPTLAPIADENA
ncbi:hypothetical protein BD779DRAFT_1208700 [Infundibulicybe gibba]|nr:hypothetical protein BD779DRAFT_1208700 [Infundibulicybe gibba]